MANERVNVTLDPEHAEKLTRMAARAHVSNGTLARSLLSAALDDAEPDPEAVTTLLDAIPGALERSEEGWAQIERGQGIELDGLPRWRES